MAVKEIGIKVVIEGQEIVLTGKQVELFKQNIIALKETLTALGERTEENGKLFDKLTGDIEKLEKVFGKTKDEAKDTGDEFEEMGEKSEESGKKVKSLRAQLAEARNSLAALGPRTAENAAEFDRLTTKVQDLSEEYEDLQFGTKKLDDALAAIPGPIGQVAQGFKTLDDASKNIKSAFGTLSRSFKEFRDDVKNFKLSDLKTSLNGLKPSLDGMKTGILNVGKAIIASGVGALVIVLGLLAAAFIKSLASMKPLQDAVGRLGVLFETLMDVVKPYAEFVANVLIKGMDALAKAIAWATGNLDEYNKKLADKKATEEAAKNLEKQKFDLEVLGDTYTEIERKRAEAKQNAAEKIAEINKDELLDETEKARRIGLINERLQRDLAKIDTDAAEEKKKKAKEEAEKARQIEEDFQKKLKTVKNENALLSLKDEKERNKLSLKQNLETQLEEIKNLKVNDKKKQQLTDETNRNYLLKLKQFNDKILEDQKQADKDLQKQIRDIKISMIDDEKKRLEAEAAARRDDAIDQINQSKATETEKQEAIKAIKKKYQFEIDNADKTIANKNKQNLYDQINFDRETRKKELEDRLKRIQLFGGTEVELIKAAGAARNEQLLIDQQAEKDNLKKLLDEKQISTASYILRLKQLEDAYLVDKRLNEIKTEEDIRTARYNTRQKMLDDLISIAGAESDVGKALFLAKQALAIRELVLEVSRTVAFSKQALLRSKVAVAEGTAQTAKVGFPQNIPLLIGYAAQAAAIISAIISATKAKEELGGTQTATVPTGKNYERGGMIGGVRHAQGGTLIEAEQGEAIMNRGSVTMFRDVLSAMNQMGGGTSFNRNALMTSYDSPTVEKPAKAQEPMIMKTYVVSNELTNEAEKQARLKDLSTL